MLTHIGKVVISTCTRLKKILQIVIFTQEATSEQVDLESKSAKHQIKTWILYRNLSKRLFVREAHERNV